jgi:hypothetical protein
MVIAKVSRGSNPKGLKRYRSVPALTTAIRMVMRG